MFFDFKTVLGITAIFHVFSNLSKIALFRNGINKNIAIKLGIPAVIFVIIGAYITTFLPTKQIELVMNFILAILAIYLLINFNKPVQKTDKNLYLDGVASGFMQVLREQVELLEELHWLHFNYPKKFSLQPLHL